MKKLFNFFLFCYHLSTVLCWISLSYLLATLWAELIAFLITYRLCFHISLFHFFSCKPQFYYFREVTFQSKPVLIMVKYPGGSDSKESACNVGSLGLIPGLGRPPRGGHGNPLQYSCLENPTDWGAWWAAVHGSQRVGQDWATNTYSFKVKMGLGLWRFSFLRV